jgi:Rrf2 family transcriptional regulator, nitric oxide-sensitive transcriptional repressor
VRLTLHTDYGLRVLVYLASSPERVVTTTEIGRAYGISKNHLVRVAQSLRDGGFIQLTAGRTGGLRLARSPSDIRIGQVVRALEPELRMVECFDHVSNTCPIAPTCGLKGFITDALEAFMTSLDDHTLAAVVSSSGPKLTSYFIPVEKLARKRTKADRGGAAKRPTGRSASPMPNQTAQPSVSGEQRQRAARSSKVPSLTPPPKGIARRRPSA